MSDMRHQFATMMAMDINIRRRMLHKMRADGVNVPSLRYVNTLEFCLFNGQLRSSNIHDTPLDPMPQGNCFGNAFSVMLDNPSFTYCEGYATMRCAGFHMPTAHAWLEDEQGMIHDPTWKDVIHQQTPQGQLSDKAFRAVGEAIYVGVRIPRRAAMISALLHDTVNVIEFNGGEMMNPFILVHGMEHFEHLVAGHLGDAPFTSGAVKDSEKLPMIARLADTSLEYSCRKMIEHQPKWVRHPSGVGYVLEGTDKTWGVE